MMCCSPAKSALPTSSRRVTLSLASASHIPALRPEDFMSLLTISSVYTYMQCLTHQFTVVGWVNFPVSPWRHPQLTVGVDIHVSNQVSTIFVKIPSHVSDLDLGEWAFTVVSLTAWIATRPWICSRDKKN